MGGIQLFIKFVSMKFILCLILVVGGMAASAQDCKLIRDVDPYTKEVKLSSGFMSLQGATLTIDADSKEIDFFFAIPDKCFNDASTVFIFFEGSRAKMTYRNAGSVNCDGNFHVIYRNTAATNSILQKLGTLKVAQFIFQGTDKKDIIISLLPAQQQQLQTLASCVTTQGKTLIK
jgi:hypothetical protein